MFSIAFPNFLSLQKGEEVKLIEGDVDGWMKVRRKGGEEGYVPTAYLKKLS